MNIPLNLSPQNISVVRQALDAVRKQADFESCKACIEIMDAIDTAVADAGAEERKQVQNAQVRGDVLKAIEMLEAGAELDAVLERINSDTLHASEETEPDPAAVDTPAPPAP